MTGDLRSFLPDGDPAKELWLLERGPARERTFRCALCGAEAGKSASPGTRSSSRSHRWCARCGRLQPVEEVI